MITFSLRSSNLVARPHISHRGVPVVASETLVALIRVCFCDDEYDDDADDDADYDDDNDDDGDHLGSLVGVGVEEAADDKVNLAADEQNQQQLLHLVGEKMGDWRTISVGRGNIFEVV